MNHYNNSMLLNNLADMYEEFTNVEKSIADFFMNNKESLDFSSKNISSLLYVSEASLSRFVKKCGFKGYREFVYEYECTLESKDKNINELTQKVLTTYQRLLDQNASLINEEQMYNIAKLLTECKKVYVYGMGSSGITAQEFKLRFMRLGLQIDAISDAHMMKMNSALVDEDTLVIGISISGETKEILAAMNIAKEHKAHTLMITANRCEKLRHLYKDVLYIAVTKGLDNGTCISPQFPVLLVVDLFYTYFLNTDLFHRSEVHTKTLSALYRRAEQED